MLSLFFHLLILPIFAAQMYEGKMPWGRDQELVSAHVAHLQNNCHFEAAKKNPDPLKISETMGIRSCTAMIRFFQNHISPIDGPRSSYFPSSSQYTLLAICKYGVLSGIALGCDRLLRENSETWVYPIATQQGLERKVDLLR